MRTHKICILKLWLLTIAAFFLSMALITIGSVVSAMKGWH
jgi:hypothetical protein